MEIIDLLMVPNRQIFLLNSFNRSKVQSTSLIPLLGKPLKLAMLKAYSTLTNTEGFYDKTPHITDCAGSNYQVGDNIGVVRSGGSLSPAYRMSPLDSTWLPMCGPSTCDPLIGFHMRGRVESHIGYTKREIIV
ncbi:unnamed protein product [Malus baccata var. baccata]